MNFSELQTELKQFVDSSPELIETRKRIEELLNQCKELDSELRQKTELLKVKTEALENVKVTSLIKGGAEGIKELETECLQLEKDIAKNTEDTKLRLKAIDLLKEKEVDLMTSRTYQFEVIIKKELKALQEKIWLNFQDLKSDVTNLINIKALLTGHPFANITATQVTVINLYREDLRQFREFLEGICGVQK